MFFFQICVSDTHRASTSSKSQSVELTNLDALYPQTGKAISTHASVDVDAHDLSDPLATYENEHIQMI